MKKAVSISFIIMLAVACARFCITLTMARHLPKADVGLFNLVISLSFLLSAFGLMGQHLGLVRFFSSHPLGEYAWKGFLARVFGAGLLLALAGSLVAGAIYRFDAVTALACFILTACIMVQEYCASIFRAQQRYYLSLVLGQLLPVLFLGLLFILFFVAALSLKTILLLYTAVSLLFSLASVRLTLSLLPSGAKELPREAKRQGYLLFGIAITFVLFNQADIMLVAGLISLESLAVYTVILSIMKLYDFGSMALNHVLVPRIGKMPGRQLRKVFAAALGFALFSTALYLLVGNSAVEVLYKGEYDAGAMLIPIFCLAGILKLVYTVPSSLIAAVSTEVVMKRFLYLNLVALLLNYLTNIYLISALGLAGAALGASLAWLFRVLGAMVLSRLVPRMRAAHDPPVGADYQTP